MDHLKKGLDKLKTYKEELLICLNYPATPLHNNQSERDIREYVKKEKSMVLPEAPMEEKPGTPLFP